MDILNDILQRSDVVHLYRYLRNYKMFVFSGDVNSDDDIFHDLIVFHLLVFCEDY